jgi:hypothetical protein
VVACFCYDVVVIDGCDGLAEWLDGGESGQCITCPASVESGWEPLSSHPEPAVGTSVDVSPIRTDFHCRVIAVTRLFTVGITLIRPAAIYTRIR